ncbi:high mobility group nucleosome-binding domain-containing protein 5-like [Diachasma alloeum]|uniref:high mobility group nucleosome-binding domain-containing protein 5-like n=1 Tax=Diachasma alloeum TaxID=454923 RepID=UPI0007384787|nr:high mobility group nucleosome-binding domain-containing protein 5-like [Diachasma alloeum]
MLEKVCGEEVEIARMVERRGDRGDRVLVMELSGKEVAQMVLRKKEVWYREKEEEDEKKKEGEKDDVKGTGKSQNGGMKQKEDGEEKEGSKDEEEGTGKSQVGGTKQEKVDKE